MATRKNIRAMMEAAMKALDESKAKQPRTIFGRERGPMLYTDREIAEAAQDKYTARTTFREAPPKARRTRITGKWWEIGELGQDAVTPHQSKRLQYYFDLASEPDTKLNAWPLYFEELARYGASEWDASDWRKWRIWYFSLHPERRAVYQQHKANRTKSARRWSRLTKEQRNAENAKRRERRKRQKGQT